MPERLDLQLFIAGRQAEAAAVAERIDNLFQRLLKIPYALEVIDVLEAPQLADVAHVLVTPTLVVRLDGVERRLVGDLGDLTRLQLVIADAGGG